MNGTPRLAVLGSGRGSNFIALQEAILAGRLDAVIVVVISDLAEAPILARAAAYGLETQILPTSPFKTKLHPEGETALLQLLDDREIDWVILAGYMRVVKEPLLSAYAGRIVNIHPSLLPAFKGLRAWEQAVASGATESGCTVHFVNGEVDGGNIIGQERVPVLSGDTPDDLHARIQAAEHRLYPASLARLFSAAS